MDRIRAYLLSVTAVCMISAICIRMIELPRVKGVIRFITGILILLVAGSALVSLDPQKIEDLAGEMAMDLEIRQEDLEQEVRDELAEHVKSTAENYIEQKASELGATVQAKVTVSEEEYPVPYAVTIIGILTPNQRTALGQYLSQSLNIPMERQVWK